MSTPVGKPPHSSTTPNVRNWDVDSKTKPGSGEGAGTVDAKSPSHTQTGGVKPGADVKGGSQVDESTFEVYRDVAPLDKAEGQPSEASVHRAPPGASPKPGAANGRTFARGGEQDTSFSTATRRELAPAQQHATTGATKSEVPGHWDKPHPAIESQNDWLVKQLQAGNPDVVETLHDVDPASFTPTQLGELAVAAAQGGTNSRDAESVLQNSAALDPQFKQKLHHAANKLVGTHPGGLDKLLEAATPHRPDAVVNLVRPSSPKLQEAADYALQQQLSAGGEGADRTAQAILKDLTIQPMDQPYQTGQNLAKEAIGHFHSKLKDTGTLSQEDMSSVVDFTGRQANHENVYVATPLKLLEKAIVQDEPVPGAAQTLVDAFTNPETYMDARTTVFYGDRKLGDVLYPLVKDMKAPNTKQGDFIHKDLKQQVAFKLGPPVRWQQMLTYNKQFTEKFTEAVKNAKDGSKLGQFRKLMQAQHILQNHKKFSSIDPEDYDAGKLQQKIQSLVSDSGFRNDVQEIRYKLQDEVFGHRFASGQNLHDYLESDRYQKYLSLLSPKEQEKSVQGQLKTLAALEPWRAKEAMQHLQSDAILDKGLERLAQMPPETREKLLGEVIRSEASAFRKTAGFLDKLNAAFEFRGTEGLVNADTGQLLNHKDRLKYIAQESGVSLQVAKKLATVASVAALADLDFSDPSKVARSVGDISKVAGKALSLPQIEKMLPGAANKLVKYLGPAGSAASSVSNFINAAEAIENGNVDGAVFQGLQGIGNAASAAGGAGLLLGLATGPLMIGGGILAFGAWLGEELFGDTPEENLLESLDLER